jgi:hypothetical protein
MAVLQSIDVGSEWSSFWATSGDDAPEFSIWHIIADYNTPEIVGQENACDCYTDYTCVAYYPVHDHATGALQYELPLKCSWFESLRQFPARFFQDGLVTPMLKVANEFVLPFEVSDDPEVFPSQESLIGELFEKAVEVDRWEYRTNFTAYFDACSPSACVYSVSRQMGYAELAARIFAVMGGLDIFLKLILGALFKMPEDRATREYEEEMKSTGREELRDCGGDEGSPEVHDLVTQQKNSQKQINVSVRKVHVRYVRKEKFCEYLQEGIYIQRYDCTN